jgi:predicted nuclease with TOPRIM domain
MSDKKLERIEDKIDHIQEKISSIDVTLAKQHESLEIHIKRTNILEQKLEPVENHVVAVNTVLKVIGFSALALGIIEGVLKLING